MFEVSIVSLRLNERRPSQLAVRVGLWKDNVCALLRSGQVSSISDLKLMDRISRRRDAMVEC